MRRTTRQPKAVSVTAASVLAVLAYAVGAAAMSSSNYTVQSDSINFGGAFSSSASYQVQDSIGELATGEDFSSTSYKACAGFSCLAGESFITFTLTQGTSSPGTAGAGIGFGTLTPGSVATSNGSSINSIFMTLEAVATGGVDVTVVSEKAGLGRTSAPASIIDSATTDLSITTEGYGLCVESVTEDPASPTSLVKESPYNGACDKTSNHNIGSVDLTPNTILSASGNIVAGEAEVLAKTKASATTEGGSDYSDTLTFIATANY